MCAKRKASCYKHPEEENHKHTPIDGKIYTYFWLEEREKNMAFIVHVVRCFVFLFISRVKK
jgi:hypothetical protein